MRRSTPMTAFSANPPPFRSCASTRCVSQARHQQRDAATLYAWKAKYGGMDVSQARKLKALEEEKGRLKRLLVDAMLGNAVLKDLL